MPDRCGSTASDVTVLLRPAAQDRLPARAGVRCLDDRLVDRRVHGRRLLRVDRQCGGPAVAVGEDASPTACGLPARAGVGRLVDRRGSIPGDHRVDRLRACRSDREPRNTRVGVRGGGRLEHGLPGVAAVRCSCGRRRTRSRRCCYWRDRPRSSPMISLSAVPADGSARSVTHAST